MAETPEGAELEPHNASAWDAFQALKYDRQFSGFGVALPLPFSAVDTYARRYGITGTAFDHLLLLLRALDGVWLERVNKPKAEGEGAQGGRNTA